MAKNPDDVEREIEEQRQAIGRKLDRLQDRIEDDFEGVKHGFGEGTSTIRDQAKQVFDFEAQVRDYPLVSLAGALGVGVLIGLVTDSGGGNGNRRDDYWTDRDHGRDRNRESGILGGAMGSLGGIFGSVIQDEVRQMLESGLQAFVDRRDRGQKRTGTAEGD